MFYMLANVQQQIATSEVLPPPDHFWYCLLDLPFRIQNAATSFQLELERLVNHEMPRSVVLSDATGANVPSLRTFLKILLGTDLQYDSDDIDWYAPPCMCYHINIEVPTEEPPELMP